VPLQLASDAKDLLLLLLLPPPPALPVLLLPVLLLSVLLLPSSGGQAGGCGVLLRSMAWAARAVGRWPSLRSPGWWPPGVAPLLAAPS
jgi:hypothetical protein